MGNRRQLLVALTIVLLLGGFTCFVLLSSVPPEPSYEGKLLSEWLALYDYDPGSSITLPLDRWQEVDEAVRHMGTNAFPTLLKLLRAKDSKTKNTLGQFAVKVHLIKTPPASAATLNARGAKGFQALGAAGYSPPPDLAKILDENISENSQASTCYAIGGFWRGDADAVPALVRLAANGPIRVRYAAFSALGNNHARPELSVPVLLKGIDDPDRNISMLSIHSLPSYNMNAAPAVPRIVAEFATNNTGLVVAIFTPEEALKSFNARARQELVIPALIPLLRDADPEVRARTAKLLGDFRRDAASALPVLRELLNDADSNVRVRAKYAVDAIDPENAAQIPALYPPNAK